MQGTRLGIGDTAARALPSCEARTRDRSAFGELLLRKAGEAARCAQHAAGNLDNRHVEIVCAASARVNVSVLYQFVDTANRSWPSSIALRLVFPVGQRVARSLPERWPAVLPRGLAFGSRPSTRARRGSLVAAPFKSGQEWTPGHATLLCSSPCRSSAQASPGFWITLFWVRSFLRSV